MSEWPTLCQAELQKLRQQALETKHFIEKQEVEERKLLRIIAEADGERVRQKKELDQVEAPCHSPTNNYESVALGKSCVKISNRVLGRLRNSRPFLSQ